MWFSTETGHRFFPLSVVLVRCRRRRQESNQRRLVCKTSVVAARTTRPCFVVIVKSTLYDVLFLLESLECEEVSADDRVPESPPRLIYRRVFLSQCKISLALYFLGIFMALTDDFPPNLMIG